MSTITKQKSIADDEATIQCKIRDVERKIEEKRYLIQAESINYKNVDKNDRNQWRQIMNRQKDLKEMMNGLFIKKKKLENDQREYLKFNTKRKIN